MKTLIVYATREGQTARVAGRIANHLRQAGIEVQLADAGDAAATGQIDLDGFDQLVFGASMHAGGLEKELVEFIGRHKGEIESRQRWFFLVLLSAAARDPELKAQWLADARKKTDGQLPVRFADVEMIAGALRYSKYPLPLKWVMQRIASKAGEGTDLSRDYEYTDWQQVQRYAQRLRASLIESKLR